MILRRPDMNALLRSHSGSVSRMHAVLRTIVALAALAVPIASYGQTRVYEVNSGSVNLSVIDASTNQVVAALPGPTALTPVAYNSANGLLYVPTQEQAGRLYLLDPLSNTFLANPVALGAFPIYVSVSPELGRAYVSNFFGGISVVDTTSGGVIAEVTDFASPTGSSVDVQLAKLYVFNNQTATLGVLDTGTNQVMNTVTFACSKPQHGKIDTVLHKAFA